MTDLVRNLPARWLAKRLEEGIAGSSYARALEHCADELAAYLEIDASNE